MRRQRKLASVAKECVACGSCIKVCPVLAISVYQGRFAIVDESRCVGCGKCAKACPAGVIDIVSREVVAVEEAVV